MHGIFMVQSLRAGMAFVLRRASVGTGCHVGGWLVMTTMVNRTWGVRPRAVRSLAEKPL
jgi:hypothetical protein